MTGALSVISFTLAPRAPFAQLSAISTSTSRKPCRRSGSSPITAPPATGYRLAGEEARAFDRLPVSAELLDRLARWNDGYERCDPQDYEDVCGMRFDFLAFATEGLEIAKAVKRALPSWTVLYWDESLDWFLAREPRNYNPARSEYEVTLKDALATRPASPAFDTQMVEHGIAVWSGLRRTHDRC